MPQALRSAAGKRAGAELLHRECRERQHPQGWRENLLVASRGRRDQRNRMVLASDKQALEMTRPGALASGPFFFALGCTAGMKSHVALALVARGRGRLTAFCANEGGKKDSDQLGDDYRR